MLKRYIKKYISKPPLRALIISLFFFSFWYLTAGYAFAEKQISYAPWPHEESDISPDPSVIYGRLANGFRYVLMKNHEPKDRVNIRLDVQAGSIQEEDGEEGLAHYLEHILFCGSTHFKPGELVKYFQDMGMQFGPDANAHTGFYETVYDILLPDGKKESLEKGLLIVEDFAKGALLPDSEVERERKVILAEKRARDSPNYRTLVSAMKFKFPDAAVSKRFPIGETEVIEKMTSQKLRDFYQAWYRPENIVLIIVGDFDSKTAISLIVEKFPAFSPGSPAKPEPPFGDISHNGIKPFYHYEKEEGSTSVGIETVNKAERVAETSERRKERFIGDIADRIVQNRLDGMVRKKKAPFTSASISSGIYLQRIRYAGISADCSPENWEKSISIVEQTLRSALEHGFTRREFERVKKDFTAMLDNAVKQESTRDSKVLANEIVWHINNHKVFQSPLQEKEFYSGVLSSLSLNDLHDSFKNTWDTDHRIVILTGNADLKGEMKPEDRIVAAYRKSLSVEIPKSSEQRTAVFPYLPEPAGKGKIMKKTIIPDPGIVQIDFENGVRLNLKKTDYEANEIRANILFGFGSSAEPPGLEGISDLSAAVINESGLGGLDRDEMEEALAGKSTKVSFVAEDGRFLLKGISVTDETQLLFSLFYAHIMDPGYREESYLLSMERLSQTYLELSRSIDGAMHLSGERFLAGGDTRFGFPSPEKLKKLSLNDVRAWIDPSLKNDPLEISVVGDFNEESVIEFVSLYFGSLPERPRGFERKRPDLPKFSLAGFLNINVETEIGKAHVVVAYPTEDIWNIQRTRRFNILAEIVSEKMREEIREKMGAAYSYSAYNNPSRAYPGYGIFYAQAAVNPDEVLIVEEKIKKIVSETAGKGVVMEDLKRSADPILTMIKDMLRSNKYWLNNVLTESVRYPAQIEWSRTIIKDYESVTADELSELAAKYLDNGKAATIIIKPAEIKKKRQ
ncbi:MAG: insulinase family protein [Desulfobacteraceae bacterium]|nr:MAG: insulinase family protein [Desulfobacteraceae bacterium]